jgi:hypothetical protein
MGGTAGPPLPPHAYLENCLFRKLPILAIIGNWYVIKIPRIIAALLQKCFIKKFYILNINKYFCPNPAIAGLQEHCRAAGALLGCRSMGGSGGTGSSPQLLGIGM